MRLPLPQTTSGRFEMARHIACYTAALYRSLAGALPGDDIV